MDQVFHFFVGTRLRFSAGGLNQRGEICPNTPLELRFIVIECLSRIKTLDEKTSGNILACKFCATRSDNGFDALRRTAYLFELAIFSQQKTLNSLRWFLGIA